MDREWKRRGASLDSVKRSKHEIIFMCRRTKCGHRGVAALDKLIARFGGSFVIDSLMEYAVCSRCKARWPHVGWYLADSAAVMKDAEKR
jgi:hypothetical protein